MQGNLYFVFMYRCYSKTSGSANLQLFVWIFCGIILVNVYTAYLVAHIATFEAAPPFVDLKSLVQQTEYIFGMKYGGAFYTWLEVNSTTLLVMITLSAVKSFA